MAKKLKMLPENAKDAPPKNGLKKLYLKRPWKENQQMVEKQQWRCWPNDQKWFR